MIDRISALLDKRGEVFQDVDYAPTDAIADQKLTELPGVDTLTVVCGPWHGSERLDQWVRSRLASSGSSALQYNFSPYILNLDPKSVRESFEHASSKIARDINNPPWEHDYKRINLLGFSLGNLALSMTASQIDTYNAATMVVPGDNLAEPFMTGVRTSDMGEQYSERDIDLEFLKECWRDLAPSAHVAAFVGHPMHLVLAARDKYIPYASGKQFVADLRSAGHDPAVDISRMGHLATVVRYAKLGHFKKTPTV